MIRGIIFDKDGTLFDFHQSWGVWAAGFLATLSPDSAVQAHLARVIGYDPATARFASDSPVIAGTPDDITDVLIAHLPEWTRADLVACMNEEAARAPMVPAVPLLPLLDRLRERGLVLGVATNDSEQPARVHLETHGIADHFAFVAGSDSGFGGKPAAGQLHAFCRHTGFDPAEVIMVGDSTHDLAAARAAGMISVGVLTGPAMRADLQPLADAVLTDIGALPEWIEKLQSPDA
ncbi:HAD family hydrolase [Falsirhodobacter sp. alg1]|uniref:HAD family hydrolase n=1 Tax=Falsirhodobacter sp. alg1 TaxID=1472418 RepID=UPI0005EE2BB5|nr:HAD family hydrolase [Falsirhodobacter sp. alg1]